MRLGRTADMAQHLLRIRGALTTEFLPARGRVLEIGPGEVEYDRRGCDVIPINIGPRGAPRVYADAQALPFKDGAFDGVIATEVIEHVRYPYRLLREVRRVLRRDGRALLSTPNVAIPVNRAALALFGRFPDDETLHDGQDVGHIHFFTRGSFLEAVRREGFTVLRERDYLLQVLPGTYLYDTALERAFRNHAKMIMLELGPA